MASKNFYYARVSSTSQNLARQIEAFKKDGADDRDIITEKKSGKNIADRPEYLALRNHMLREGDTLVVMSLDRLGRNKNEIKQELQYYKDHKIRVRILDLPTSNVKTEPGQEWIIEMVNNLLIEVLSSMAEQERITIRKRQMEGIAIAKAEGKFKGSKPHPIDEEKFKALYQQYASRNISKAEMARQLGVSRPRMDRILQRKGLLKKKNASASYS